MSHHLPVVAIRKDLCENFKAGAKPTGDQFAQLIHSLVHQTEDGMTFTKVVAGPGIEAHTAVTVKGRFDIEHPATIDPPKEATLAVHGATMLKGHVGIGIEASAENALHVNGSVKIDKATTLLGPLGLGSSPNQHYTASFRAVAPDPTYDGWGRDDGQIVIPRSRWLLLTDEQGHRRWHIDHLHGGFNIGEGDEYEFDLCRLFISKGGNVGIGTTEPQTRLHVAGSVTVDGHHAELLRAYRSFDVDEGASHIHGSKQMPYVSITARHAIHAECFRAVSDARLKERQAKSDSSQDLARILQIEITDYVHKDVVEQGERAYKKVIAQQVEQVFPQAVKRTTGVVPDIYQQSACIGDGWLRLASNLKAGERVRLISGEEQGIHEVLEVAEDAFRIAFEPQGKDVFVYGREVDDLRTVDYDAISMLNVSATQELHRHLEQQAAVINAREEKIAALEQRLTELETRDSDREARLVAMEALLRTQVFATARLADGFPPDLCRSGSVLVS